MIMSNADIVREYKAAKTPMKQIGILADQNLCKKKDIVEILMKEGCEVPKFYKPKDNKEEPVQVAADTNVGTKMPETVAAELETVATELETVLEAPAPDTFFRDIDAVAPINNGGYIFAEAAERGEIKEKLYDALKTVMNNGLEFHKDVKKIRCLSEGINQLLQINADVDLTAGGSTAIMQAVSAFAKEINLLLYAIESSLGEVNTTVANALSVAAGDDK